jgi:hypothetical protein
MRAERGRHFDRRRPLLGHAIHCAAARLNGVFYLEAQGHVLPPRMPEVARFKLSGTWQAIALISIKLDFDLHQNSVAALQQRFPDVLNSDAGQQ